MKNIHKAIKLPLIYLTAFVCLASSASLNAESTPEQQALAIFKPLLTDLQYKNTESFYSMCVRAIPLLKKSNDPDVVKFAEALDKVASKGNLLVIGNALKKYEAVIVKYLTEKLLNTNILIARLKEALTLKN